MNLGCASVTGLTVQDFVEARHDAQVYSALIASYPTINKPDPYPDKKTTPQTDRPTDGPTDGRTKFVARDICAGPRNINSSLIY